MGRQILPLLARLSHQTAPLKRWTAVLARRTDHRRRTRTTVMVNQRILRPMMKMKSGRGVAAFPAMIPTPIEPDLVQTRVLNLVQIPVLAPARIRALNLAPYR